ncbi:hypothetical protein QTP70_013442 [Hemibagrus guttatus]|uniref:Uncharacterized protein n=1 Tax=Hemibagrus guttatus TaxID=175788 RepID=A0AAE0UW18_9TELE|nr:hypothetical protein QTP70_013442 [Hemibagrus guttatus]
MQNIGVCWRILVYIGEYWSFMPDIHPMISHVFVKQGSPEVKIAKRVVGVKHAIIPRSNVVSSLLLLFVGPQEHFRVQLLYKHFSSGRNAPKGKATVLNKFCEAEKVLEAKPYTMFFE